MKLIAPGVLQSGFEISGGSISTLEDSDSVERNVAGLGLRCMAILDAVGPLTCTRHFCTADPLGCPRDSKVVSASCGPIGPTSMYLKDLDEDSCRSSLPGWRPT